jgi:aconitate hydratase 2/2-methylisocitrate dehydratase
LIALRPWYTHVFLGSAERAAACSKLGRVPTVAECQQAVGIIDTT